jgi:hypothetical protein
MTWEELREMGENGLIDIQSHTLSHARYFVSPGIKGFNSGTPPWWLPLASGGNLMPGIPVYQDQKALLARRYFDDKGLRNYLARYVKERGGGEFFKSGETAERHKELFSAVEEYEHKYNHRRGYFETEKDRKERLKKELNLSKREIEKRLGKECLFLAWPWGRYNEELTALAGACGYQGAVTVEKGANISGDNLMYLKRFDIKTGNLRWFKARLFMYNHGIIAKVYPVIRGK